MTETLGISLIGAGGNGLLVEEWREVSPIVEEYVEESVEVVVVPACGIVAPQLAVVCIGIVDWSG